MTCDDGHGNCDFLSAFRGLFCGRTSGPARCHRVSPDGGGLVSLICGIRCSCASREYEPPERVIYMANSGTGLEALTMRRYLVAMVLAFIAVPTVTDSVVQAEVIYPWCAWTGGGGPRDSSSATNCGFVSWSQCRATATTMGFCEPNPFYFALCKRNCGDPYSEVAVRAPIRRRLPRPTYAPN